MKEPKEPGIEPDNEKKKNNKKVAAYIIGGIALFSAGFLVTYAIGNAISNNKAPTELEGSADDTTDETETTPESTEEVTTTTEYTTQPTTTYAENTTIKNNTTTLGPPDTTEAPGVAQEREAKVAYEEIAAIIETSGYDNEGTHMYYIQAVQDSPGSTKIIIYVQSYLIGFERNTYSDEKLKRLDNERMEAAKKALDEIFEKNSAVLGNKSDYEIKYLNAGV